MRLVVADSRRVTRVVHALLGTNALLIGGVAVWSSRAPESVAVAVVVGIFGVYNLIGAGFPAAVVFPTAGSNADLTVFRLVHGVGVVFFAAIAGVAHWSLGLTPLALLSLLLVVYDAIGLVVPGLYPAMAILSLLN
jgi:hypothetical protein